MNIKRLCFFCIAFWFLIISGNTFGQDKAGWPPKQWPHDHKNCFHLLSNSYQCTWKAFDIKGTLEGVVIAWDKINGKTDALTCASVCILKTGKGTIRILIAGNASHKTGDHIKITKSKEPAADVSVPLDRDYYLAEEKNGSKPDCRINEYDNRILKTAWGKIVQ